MSDVLPAGLPADPFALLEHCLSADRAGLRRRLRGLKARPATLADLPQDRQLVLYCKSGVRSAEALAAVKNAGFRDAVHVQGGVVGWVKQIDPSLPIY